MRYNGDRPIERYFGPPRSPWDAWWDQWRDQWRRAAAKELDKAHPRLVNIGLNDMGGPNGSGYVYLSGPMTGYPEFNFPEFHRVAKVLRDMGYAVISPAELGEVEGWTHADYLRRDIGVLATRCSEIVMLPGWRESKGACAELEAARWFGYPVGYYYSATGTLEWHTAPYKEYVNGR